MYACRVNFAINQSWWYFGPKLFTVSCYPIQTNSQIQSSQLNCHYTVKRKRNIVSAYGINKWKSAATQEDGPYKEVIFQIGFNINL